MVSEVTTGRKIEIVDDAPPAIYRPLSLVDGCAYLVTWRYAKVTKDGRGNGAKLNNPLTTNEYIRYILRENGLGWDEEIAKSGLKLEVHVNEMPPRDKLMSGTAVKAYQSGYRPDPVDVFRRVVDLVDHHIDFSRSLADQRTVAEMVGCYILATWFLDAFNVIGYLWPNGDRGCGKTQLLTVVAELAYLGMLVLAGGSYASLRDMADYGACLCFDDAENMSGRNTDPDKRALLLSGNRRGSIVSVKELGPDRNWRTRYVKTFCPRAFSATRLPDPILESRSIVIPLIRTTDREKAGRDPADYDSWPHDRRKLIDDLWALGLSRLSEIPNYERIVSLTSRLSGRNLEPWRAILAVARWLAAKGVCGLLKKIEQLSFDYQTQRHELVTADTTILTIRALCHCANSAISANNKDTLVTFTITTQEVTETVRKIAREEDIEDDDITNNRIGRVLGSLRLNKIPRPGGQGSRVWQVTRSDLMRLTDTYSVPFPDTLNTSGTDGTSGTNGTENSSDSEDS